MTTREEVVSYLAQCEILDIEDICNEAIRAGWQQIKVKKFGPTTLTVHTFGDNKIQLIKLIRSVTGEGLKESKVRSEDLARNPWTFPIPTDRDGVDREPEIVGILDRIGARYDLTPGGEQGQIPEAEAEYVEPGPLNRTTLLFDEG